VYNVIVDVCDFSQTFPGTVTWWSHSSVWRCRQIGDVSLVIFVFFTVMGGKLTFTSVAHVVSHVSVQVRKDANKFTRCKFHFLMRLGSKCA